MRYLLSSALIIASLLGFTSLTSSVGATSTVSGETRITSPIKPKPVLKSQPTSTQKKKLLEMQEKTLSDIAIIKARMLQYNTYISYIKTKIDARKKAGNTDNRELEAKLKALKKSLLQDKTDLAILMEKLAYVESKLK